MSEGLKIEIINIEFLGEDGAMVYVSFNNGVTAVLEKDNPRVIEYIKSQREN